MIVRPAASSLDVLTLGLAAALTASLGPVLLVVSARHVRRALGHANALAAGMMLGIGYVLMTAGIQAEAVGATLGAALGVVVMYWVHVALGIGDVVDGDGKHRPFIAATVHATAEGIALGAAAALGHTMAVVVAGTLALHNASESAVTASQMTTRPNAGRRDSWLAVLSNLPQVVIGLLVFAVATRWPAALGPLLGASFGAFIYLCLSELLPASYHGAGRTGIAVGVTVAAGIVALVSATA